jgi:hypothetical protein
MSDPAKEFLQAHSRRNHELITRGSSNVHPKQLGRYRDKAAQEAAEYANKRFRSWQET